MGCPCFGGGGGCNELYDGILLESDGSGVEFIVMSAVVGCGLGYTLIGMLETSRLDAVDVLSPITSN